MIHVLSELPRTGSAFEYWVWKWRSKQVDLVSNIELRS
jgi:hypothetical protein